MAYDEELAIRVRTHLSIAGEVVERRMMGALCFMLHGHMCCGVTGNALMVRVGRDDYEAALEEDHVRPMDISGRILRGFVLVDPPGVKTGRSLRFWIGRACGLVSTLPAREG
ncbi:TfoX/Sxy family protein [uncultured Nitratireductor sp.]|uniref:TfoX/Sxy family protein n=1 Tax=uncultured Nitratireductor sp. TaxID=520953 RepID=UPI0025F5BF67|nr:TfoX/Sxy family protein [uncultured Nitratireductor sp.]